MTSTTMTDLGRHAGAVAGLPGDLAAIVSAVQGLFLHEGWAGRYGVTVAHPGSAHLRRTEDLLDAAGERPLGEARDPADRVATMCRSFSVVTVAMLRAHGFEARARAGFADYFLPGFHEDHWVVQWRDGDRWRLADPQIDALQRDALGLAFDPLDLPAARFLTGPDAWRQVRSGTTDPDSFGFSGAPEMKGEWFVARSVILDRAALAGVEALPWDAWAPMPGPDDAVDVALIDRLAAGDGPVTVPAEVLNTRRGTREKL
ncbi:transglutaminase-like domain-containing protein [Actinoplanes sp. M2I2]|uniref:transglutaminase-like domain-containing protein n=1 Tax=Actinoplanes sp. M2I2 TaxID=1734444 RepID=UPI002020C50A|nr:transglutaminase-like domain-containing protein [Actinoplanes sp. M2I2]